MCLRAGITASCHPLAEVLFLYCLWLQWYNKALSVWQCLGPRILPFGVVMELHT